MSGSKLTREPGGVVTRIGLPEPGSTTTLPVTTGSFVVLAEDQSVEQSAIIFPSYGIARAEAQLQVLRAVETAAETSLAAAYQAKITAAKQACASDLEAWAQHGFIGEAEPQFGALARAVHPKLLQRAGFGVARYLVAGEARPKNELYDDMLSEYVRACQPGLWRNTGDARTMLDQWFHGRAIRSLAAEHREYEVHPIEVSVPQQQCSRASVAAISCKLQELLSWYIGPDNRAASQKFAVFSDWAQLMASSELLPGLESDALWAETRNLIEAARLSVGTDCQRRVDREKIQQAIIHWAQWGLWSQRVVR